MQLYGKSYDYKVYEILCYKTTCKTDRADLIRIIRCYEGPANHDVLIANPVHSGQ